MRLKLLTRVRKELTPGRKHNEISNKEFKKKIIKMH